MLQKFLTHLLMLGVLLSTLACSREEEEAPPTFLTVGVLPDEDVFVVGQRYAPLLTHLSAELGAKLQLVIPQSYAELVELFGGGEIDIAYFGGVTFFQAHKLYGAVPLVSRDIDINFTSYFLAGPDIPAEGVEEFTGRTFAFGSELSTSGHWMPRYFLQERGIEPERFFGAVRYAGTHDRTVSWVRDGVVDLGAVNSEIVKAMFRDGRLERGEVRLIWETPPYANYVWAVRPEVGEGFRTRLRDAFLELSPAEEPDGEILERMGAGGFLPVSVNDFSRIERILQDLPRFPVDR